jgi:hypothetical protein
VKPTEAVISEYNDYYSIEWCMDCGQERGFIGDEVLTCECGRIDTIGGNMEEKLAVNVPLSIEQKFALSDIRSKVAEAKLAFITQTEELNAQFNKKLEEIVKANNISPDFTINSDYSLVAKPKSPVVSTN